MKAKLICTQEEMLDNGVCIFAYYKGKPTKKEVFEYFLEEGNEEDVKFEWIEEMPSILSKYTKLSRWFVQAAV